MLYLQIFGVGLCILCSKYMFKDVLSYKYYHKTDILLGMILFAFSLYPVVQGTLLLIGINKVGGAVLLLIMLTFRNKSSSNAFVPNLQKIPF